MSTITTPTGMILEMRGLTGKDGRYLTNEQLVRDNEIEDYILQNCTLRVLEEGIYNLGSKPMEWGKALIGDRAFLLVSILEETYPGQPYPLKMKCPVRSCRFSFEWEIEIAKLLKEKVRPLSKEDRILMKDENAKFSVTIPTTDKLIYFRPKTGDQLKRFVAAQDQLVNASKKKKERANQLVDNLLFFLTEIQGVDKKSPDARQEFLESISLGAINDLRIEMEKHDCGLDTGIEIECPKCHYEWSIELPFNRDFFAPRKSSSQTRGSAAGSQGTETIESESGVEASI